MEPYSQTPLNLALRSERKAEEFIKTWRFNHAALYYQKAADNITRALEEERANKLVPNSILESLEEQRKFYLYQEQVCHNRRSHVGHLFKDKSQLSYNISKQAEQFAQAHSLLICSQNYLQQQSQQLERLEARDKFEDRVKREVLSTKDHATRLIADAIEPFDNLSNKLDETLKIGETTDDKTAKTRKIEKIIYNITSNPLCDHPVITITNNKDTTKTIATTSTALVLRPHESSLAVMANSSHHKARLPAGLTNRQNPMEPYKEDPDDYDLGDKFNGGSVAYRNVLYEINRLFSEHNTLLDYLSNNRNQQKQFSRQSTQGTTSELNHHRPIQTILFSEKPDDKDIGKTNEMLSPKYSNEWKEEINDQKFSDTLNKLRWNQSKLRNIISDLVQQLEKTSEDNERLKCQIMTRTRPDSRSDQLCHLPPLEPPTLHY